MPEYARMIRMLAESAMPGHFSLAMCTKVSSCLECRQKLAGETTFVLAMSLQCRTTMHHPTQVMSPWAILINYLFLGEFQWHNILWAAFLLERFSNLFDLRKTWFVPLWRNMMRHDATEMGADTGSSDLQCAAQARFGCRGARLVACLNRHQFADPTDGIYSCGKPEFAGLSSLILVGISKWRPSIVSQKTNSCHREIYNLLWVLPLETCFDVTEPEGNDIHSALSSKRWRRWEFFCFK